MDKAQAIQIARKHGADFIANVIETHHRRPIRKLIGLAQLLDSGHDVRTAQFTVDVLVIDGRRFDWEVLASPNLVERWKEFAPREQESAR